MDILHHDDHLLIANKPAGLLTVPGRGPDKQDCLINRLLTEHPNSRIVHRLDMATSGLVIIAQSLAALQRLSRLFEQRHIQKEYTAVVSGLVAQDRGSVTLPLICDWPNRPKQKVCEEHGKSAHTDFEVLSRQAVPEDIKTPALSRTRVQLKPVTGRSHQLRVHMQAIKHPILGDEFYADDRARSASSRLLLHATRLRFDHPFTGETLEIVSQPDF
ncbi:RNA pseudouridine synthase [Aestuariicella hydrocarbonica]|uniref:Dual-specificity RNA pseudouridine synthase RluA n=1 Tax=Pseudomaricurvus hydrocarbonicus TaxID=1470433 RepID=A0A9E5MJJ9_9GAMM|nr:RNA pseudouridine synthase [Aestuariicella hydrocarbonica]